VDRQVAPPEVLQVVVAPRQEAAIPMATLVRTLTMVCVDLTAPSANGRGKVAILMARQEPAAASTKTAQSQSESGTSVSSVRPTRMMTALLAAWTADSPGLTTKTGTHQSVDAGAQMAPLTYLMTALLSALTPGLRLLQRFLPYSPLRTERLAWIWPWTDIFLRSPLI